MLKTIIRKNNYQDSINLMLLTNEVNALEGVIKSAVMMGTDANKDIFRNSGLLTEEANEASPADMVIVIDAVDESVIETALETVDHFLSDLSVKREKKGVSYATSLESALEHLPDANLALFSIPGEYAADEMMKTLEAGLHVFSFTDNVSQEDELRLKTYAHENGLLMMGLIVELASSRAFQWPLPTLLNQAISVLLARLERVSRKCPASLTDLAVVLYTPSVLADAT